MKLYLIVISCISLSILLISCGETSHEFARDWKQDDSHLELDLVDSIPLPADFPQRLWVGYYTGSFFIYTYFVAAQGGSVTDIRLAVMDLEKGTSKSISTGIDRAGQKRGIMAIHVADGVIYTIDFNAQIVSYDFNLIQKQSLIIDYPYHEVNLIGNFLFKNGDYFITVVEGNSENMEFSPLIKVQKDGKAQYLNKDIRVGYVDNQMRDYPGLLAAAYENRVAILAQHQRKFFIANLNDGNFTRYVLPSVIPVDESPALNQVLNMQGELQGKYVKNAAFKWCSFGNGKVSLVFRQQPKEKRNASKYQLYSLDVENKIVSIIDSLPFHKPFFVESPAPGVLYILENKGLYKYLFR